MQRPRVLVVEDDPEIADLIEIYLLNEGYEVTKVTDGEKALAHLERESVQLVILDIMMPNMDGLEACRRIRRQSNVPILMLSAKSEEMDKILGLGTGADDYLTKPFNPMELVARVKSQLRRYLYLNTQPNLPDDQIEVNGIRIDPAARTVTVDGASVDLTPTEFGILVLLASHPGRVFSAEEIFERVWEEKYFHSNNTVMVHIRKIREKLKQHVGETPVIQTVWGVGYKIVKQD